MHVDCIWRRRGIDMVWRRLWAQAATNSRISSLSNRICCSASVAQDVCKGGTKRIFNRQMTFWTHTAFDRELWRRTNGIVWYRYLWQSDWGSSRANPYVSLRHCLFDQRTVATFTNPYFFNSSIQCFIRAFLFCKTLFQNLYSMNSVQ